MLGIPGAYRQLATTIVYYTTGNHLLRMISRRLRTICTLCWVFVVRIHSDVWEDTNVHSRSLEVVHLPNNELTVSRYDQKVPATAMAKVDKLFIQSSKRK